MSNASNELNTYLKSDVIKRELDIQRTVINKSFDAHWHEYFEIKLILNGEGIVSINGSEHAFKKGDLYIITPANIHAFKPKTSVELYNLTLRESIILNEPIIQKFSGFSDLFLHLSNEEFDRVFYILEFLKYENNNNLEHREIIIRNMLETLLFILIRKSSKQYVVDENYSTAIQIAVSYIKMHFREQISTSDVSSLLGFSEGYFSTLFSKTTGTSFVKYLNNLRLEYSKNLLVSNKFSITEISGMCGFKSYSNFIKAFKNKYNVLPTEYKKNN